MVDEMAEVLREQLEIAPGMAGGKLKYLEWTVNYFKKSKQLWGDPRALYNFLTKHFNLDDDVTNFTIDEVMKVKENYDRPHHGYRPGGADSPWTPDYPRTPGFDREPGYRGSGSPHDRTGGYQPRPESQGPPGVVFDSYGHPVPGYYLNKDGQGREPSQAETMKEILFELDRRQAERDALKEKDDRFADILEQQNTLIETLTAGPETPDKTETEIRADVMREVNEARRVDEMKDLKSEIHDMRDDMRDPRHFRTEGSWQDDGARAVSEVGTVMVKGLSDMRVEGIKTRNMLMQMAAEREMLGGRGARKRTDTKSPVRGETGKSADDITTGMPDEFVEEEA